MFSLFFCKADSITNCTITFSKDSNNKFDNRDSLACRTVLFMLLKYSSIDKISKY